ncbi:hypothetical protein HBN54_004341 [Hymenobacter sp. 1B]|uniref:Uncharacterized protein n=1 Tax=Hymenobacter artigasi TaxID=2719616 RepID=A0ABX1HN84_9BACT|nr:hypothetical protein [Hymenobacter artigasi]
MATTRVCPLPRTSRATVPSAGPIKGSQNRKITKSGRSARNFRPTRSHDSGFTEFKLTSISKSAGPASVLNCVWPGNKKFGYCSENVTIRTSSPASRNARASRSLYVASPPRKG